MSSRDGSSEPTPYVYIKSEDHAWVPARLIHSKDNTATVVVKKYKNESEMLVNTQKTSGLSIREEMVDLREYPNGVLPMQNTDDRGKLGNYEDMVNLPYLHEASILYNIKGRHDKGLPYTRTGDMICAVNPYRWIDSLYTENKRQIYAQRLVWQNSEEDPRASLAPHVYETSAVAYKGMAFEQQDQSILISGESGAGKTETVKICMSHIATVQEGPSCGHGQGKNSSLIVQRVLDSNPLLEAFGNAKTRRNDNSSRFGKFVQLQFDRVGKTGRAHAKLAGSKCEAYLLEKNRVVSHDDKERTFHIFYQLLAAPENEKAKIWDGLQGTSAESFKYVGKTNTDIIEGATDANHFRHTMEVLGLVGLDATTKRDLMRAICIVLQLGNISFTNDGANDDKSVVSSKDVLKALATLMGISEDYLTASLTERTMRTNGETYKVPLDPVMARDSSGALAKEIYGKVFLWLVNTINKATCAENNYPNASGKDFGIIGLLDIFGYESFAINRFEQLCINYANEKLQQKFTEDIFRSVQAEYKAEGLPLNEILYDDNIDVLDLIEGRNGLCAILNEECVRPKGSGEGFVNKALAQNKKSPCLIMDKMDRKSFGIQHYAGKVFYYADKFVTSNMDTLPTDLQECATSCSNPIISKSFLEDEGQSPDSPASKNRPRRAKSNIVALSVWTKYKNQLSQLMTNLRSTSSQYIRCIKPNTVQKPFLMEHQTTVEQLRCAGIIAAVTISRSAFPNRLNNSVVYARYNNMWHRRKYPSKKGPSQSIQEQIKADCEAILLCALQCKESDGKKAFVVGKTRSYFRAGALEFLESKRIKGLDAQATSIQKVVRGWLVRRYFDCSARDREEKQQQALRDQKEQQERLEKETAECNAVFQAELTGYENEIKAVREQLKEADTLCRDAISNVEKTTETMNAEKADLRKKLDDIFESTDAAKTRLDQLQFKLESNTKLIGYLRKQNRKLTKSATKDGQVLAGVESKNRTLADRNEQSYSLFEELDSESSLVKSDNDKLMGVWQREKDENEDLKDKVRKEQTKYMCVAENRLEIQKALAHILNTIQDQCKDGQLIENAFCIAHECETEAKCEMAKLEAFEEPDLTASETSDSSNMSLVK